MSVGTIYKSVGYSSELLGELTDLDLIIGSNLVGIIKSQCSINLKGHFQHS